MANKEHLEILKQGIDTWNRWRKDNPQIITDLSSAKLSGKDFSGANFQDANLQGTDFAGANLQSANLKFAKLIIANLVKADLSNANLEMANLSLTILNDANLTGANLEDVTFRMTVLHRTNFSKSTLANTTFGNTATLSNARGLESVTHRFSSTIGADTIRYSYGKLPEVFLRGCGLSDVDIEYAKLYDPNLSNNEISKTLYKIYDLRATQALQISPLFISYSHSDSVFVDVLESHLNNKGIRFWRDIHDAKAGRLEKQIDQAMRLNPTVLLILSENSLKSDWVEHEVRTARALEKDIGRDILCPVALDESWKNSPWSKRVMEQVTEYNILDFSAWRDDRKFGKIFNKLIDGLELFYK